MAKNPAALLIRSLGADGLAENIASVYRDARKFAPLLVETGSSWYPAAKNLAIKFTETDAATACGIVAALSPQTSWAQNLLNARTLVDTLTAPTFKGNVKKAFDILNGGNPLDILGGNKVRSFYRNLIDYSDPGQYVTVDRHAVNIALGGEVEGSAKALELSGVYDTVAEAYRVAANSLTDGHFFPCEVQAIVWLYWRTLHAPSYSDKDPQ